MRLLLALLVLASLPRSARADYPTEEAMRSVAAVDRSFDNYTKPAWFDGRQIAAGTDDRVVQDNPAGCGDPLKRFEVLRQSLDPAYQATDKFRAVQKRYVELAPYCKALAAAAETHKKAAEAEAAQIAAQEAADKALLDKRRAFAREISDVSKNFLYNFLELYNDKLTRTNLSGGMGGEKAAKEGYLAILPVCKAHAPLTNPTGPKASREIMDRPLDICAMAEKGESLLQAKRRWDALSGIRYHTEDYLKIARRYLDGEQKGLEELVQLMVFDQPAFVAIQDKEFAPKAKAIGETVAADAWNAAYVKNAEIKAKIDTDGTTKSFAMPKFHDAAAEGAAKKAFAKRWAGVKVRKIGTDWQKWNVWDEKLWVGSDATYDYYKLNKGKDKYQRGWALIEIPGRPYCQSREWQVSRVYNGPIKVFQIGDVGEVMKCE